METAVFSTYVLPVVIGLIMFNQGLSLSISDFKSIFSSPKSLIIGLFCQMVILPLIAFLLAFVSGLPAEIKVGIVIIAACPGGATSNLITYLLKGDVALSIPLTSINSILILFTIPGIIYLATTTFFSTETYIALPFLQTILKILFMIILPTFLGVLTRMRLTNLADKLDKYMKYLTTTLLAVVYVFTIFESKSDADISIETYWLTAPFVVILNVSGMLSGFFIAILTKLGKKKTITFVVEIGIQNSALAITLASSKVFLGDTLMAIPAVIYGMFTFFSAIIFGYLVNRWVK